MIKGQVLCVLGSKNFLIDQWCKASDLDAIKANVMNI